jgi:OOP family OmpA-OmpF porin
MKVLVVAAGIALVMGLAGCAEYDVNRIQAIKAEGGTPFTMGLTDGYRDEALNEINKEYEWSDGAAFARKAMRAAKGEVVQPEPVSGGVWEVPPAHAGDLSAARAQLVAALDGGARDRVPALAARAQVKFDCWVEEESEGESNIQCRADVLALLPQLAPPAPAAAAAAAPGTYTVYFEFNKSTITREGAQTIRDIVAAAGANGRIDLAGHTDLVGTNKYNEALSLRRVNAVRDALVHAGVAPTRISTSHWGETRPRVPTAQGVKEPTNRRVEVTIQ